MAPTSSARRAHLPPLLRFVIAGLIGVFAFVGIAYLIERYYAPSPTFVAYASAFAVDFVVSTIIFVLALVGTALFGHKLTSISDMIGKTRCPRCEGGTTTCPSCEGKGNRDVEIDVQVDCPTCHGSGRVLETCPRCTGSKQVVRPAKFDTIGPEVGARMDWNPFHFGHWQDVTVGVKNRDEQSAQFGFNVTVPGSVGVETVNDTVSLAGGVSTTRTYTFKIHGPAPYDVSFDVSPGTITVACPTCSGGGTVQTPCRACSSTGKVGQKSKVNAPCEKCNGKGRLVCTACGGSGKVHRIP